MNTKYFTSSNIRLAVGAFAMHRFFKLYRMKGRPFGVTTHRRLNEGVAMKGNLRRFVQKPDGLSAKASHNQTEVMRLLSDPKFLASSSDIAKNRFDKVWGIDPKIETSLDLQRDDLKPLKEQKLA